MELLAVVWAVDRYKRYLLGKPFTIATDHKALTSALDGNKSNKTYQSRLTRWVDRLLPYQFNIVHIPGRDMDIVDYLSRDPFNDPWSGSELDKNFVVATINSFHEALDCMNSRLKETGSLDRNENVLECSKGNEKKQSSSNDCYSNQNGPKRTNLDQNEKKQFPRLQNMLNTAVQHKPILFLSTQLNKQSVSNKSKIVEQPVSEIRKKNRLKERDVRKQIVRLVVGFTTRMAKRRTRRDSNGPKVEPLKVKRKPTFGRGGDHRDSSANKKNHKMWPKK